MGGGPRVTAEDFDRVPCLDGARALKRDLLAIHMKKETDPSKIKEQMKLFNVRANAKLEDDELRKVTEKVRRRLYTVLNAVTIDHEKREAREAAEKRRALLERHIERKIKMRDAFALKFWSEPSEKSTRFLARLRVFKVMQAAVAARAAWRAAAEATRRKLQWRRLHKELPIDVLWRDEDGWIRRCEAVVETVTVRYTHAGKVYTQAGVVADDLGPGGFYFGEDDGGGGDGRRDDGGDGDSCKDGAGAMGLDAGELSVDDVSDDDDGFDSDDGEDELRRPRALPPERPRALPPEPSGSSAADAKKAEVVAQMDAALASTARVEPGDRPEFGLPIKAEWLEKILRGEKTVELRGKGTAKVGQRIGLICSKSSTPASEFRDFWPGKRRNIVIVARQVNGHGRVLVGRGPGPADQRRATRAPAAALRPRARRRRARHGRRAPRKRRVQKGPHLCGNQTFNPTSMCA